MMDRLPDDEFLSMLAHELRTPLNAVLGWASLLRTGNLGAEEAVRAVEAIERNARAQVNLINDLLDISRIVTGRLRVEMREVDLTAVLREPLERFQAVAQGKSIYIKSAFDPAAAPVSGDAARLRQVVGILVSNAVKFTPEGGAVTVTLERVGDRARITVADTGCGISEEFLPQVLDRFRQAEARGQRSQRRLGLGLTIARHLVELHDGTIEAESAGEGQGAIFRVELPLLMGGAGRTPQAPLFA